MPLIIRIAAHQATDHGRERRSAEDARANLAGWRSRRIRCGDFDASARFDINTAGRQRGPENCKRKEVSAAIFCYCCYCPWRFINFIALHIPRAVAQHIPYPGEVMPLLVASRNTY